MASGLMGGQWNEGDVSCSVVRRVMLPDAFFAIDGLLEGFLTVLRQMEVFENDLRILFSCHFGDDYDSMESVKAGAGREEAHLAIKENALAASKEIREGRPAKADLLGRLALMTGSRYP